MEGSGTHGKQSDMMIDWMKSNNVEYEHIKKRAHDREDWHHWRPGPTRKGRAHKKNRCQITSIYNIRFHAYYSESKTARFVSNQGLQI